MATNDDNLQMHSEILRLSLTSVTLMLLGKTGAGKSSLGNVILRRKDAFVVTDGFTSTDIYEAVAKQAFVHDRKVKVIDTPGVMDTNAGTGGGEELALKGICSGISHCPDGVDAFLIVLRLDCKLTAEEFESIFKLEKLFGENFWDHTILVFTHGDCVQNDGKKFKDRLTAAQGRIPEMQKLKCKLKTEVQLVDASLTSMSSQSDAVAKQMNSLMIAVDLLVTDANKRKYTNELFQTAKLELAAETNAELQRQQEAANSELELLRERHFKLETERENDKKAIECLMEEREKGNRMLEIQRWKREEDRKKMETLEQKLQDTERELEAKRKEAAKMAEKMARRWCSIL